MNTKQSDALTKAAILVASLDADSADALLEHLEPEIAARIRNAVMQLDEIQPDQQQHIIQEFVNRTPSAQRATAMDVELDPALAQKIMTDAAQPLPTTADADASDPARPFAALHDVAPRQLSDVLIREHPQTIALVTAHLPPHRAAAVLAHLPEHLQTDILMRIARLAPAAPEIMHDLEIEMQTLVGHHQAACQPTDSGIRVLAAILASSDQDARRRWTHRLAQQDDSVSKSLPMPTASSPSFPDEVTAAAHHSSPASQRPLPNARPEMTFDQFERLDERTLAQVLATADSHLAMVALAGASPALIRRIRDVVGPAAATKLDRELQQLGPIRLDDIEHAQRCLAEIAARLTAPPTTPQREPFVVAA